MVWIEWYIKTVFRMCLKDMFWLYNSFGYYIDDRGVAIGYSSILFLLLLYEYVKVFALNYHIDRNLERTMGEMYS